jgi:type II secretory pathway component PulC
LGLKRNDVLERINGQEMDMKRGVEIFNQLKDSNHISIDLVRNGQKTTLEYDIQ